MVNQAVILDYTNWRGVRAERRVIPVEIVFCPQGTGFHPEAGWYMRVEDLDKGGKRDFAMKDIHSWRPLSVIKADNDGQ